MEKSEKRCFFFLFYLLNSPGVWNGTNLDQYLMESGL